MEREDGERVRLIAGSYLALRLDERLALEAPANQSDERAAETRFERWREQAPFHVDEDLWHRRLAADGLDETRLRELLGESEESLAHRAAPPAELRELSAAYAAQPSPDEAPLPWPPNADLDRSPFLPLVEPLIRRALGRSTAALTAIANRGAPFEPASAAAALLEPLPLILTPMLSRVMVVELHAARLEERLAGETPEARFADFVAQLRRPEKAREIFERYPVLGRELVRAVSQWERAGREMLQHLAADAAEIRERFAEGGKLGLLSEIRGAVGDPHRDGRGVFLLRFDSGLRLVYKPKSLAVEKAFQGLLGWCNERGFTPPLRTLEILDRRDHGWIEFVTASPCASSTAVSRFYERQGAHIALLYLLGGTDFHHENLVAAGEHPVLVDLETLFQPSLDVEDPGSPEEMPGAELRESVLRTHLLPNRQWGDEDNPGVDVSGLSSPAGQLTPRKVIASAGRGTDQMRYERRQVEIPGSDNRPRVVSDGEEREIEALDHAEDLRRGFVRLYDLLAAQRVALAAPAGPLAAFADAEVRILVRPTASYSVLLLESYHPHLVANALERQRHFDHLWLGVNERPFLERLIAAENADLWRGDVPLFTSRPRERDLWTAHGERLANFFAESGWASLERRLARLGDADRARQEAALRDSLQILRLSTREQVRPSYDFRPRATPATSEELLVAARRAGQRLVELAFGGGGGAAWLTLEHRAPEGWRVALAGPDLYQGAPGMAFFLAHLGALLGEERFTAAARRALHALAYQVDGHPETVPSIGAFNGWGGVIYVLAHLGTLFGEESSFDQAEAHVERLAEKIAEDEHHDVIGGAAGAILGLLALHAVRPKTRVLEVARACGEHLLARAEKQEPGLGWPLTSMGLGPLAGFSHGAAGIALALLRLADAGGDERFRQAALGGLEYERRLFDPAAANWPDLRADAAAAQGLDVSTGRFMSAWCHGAPGIGLARLAGLPQLDDAAVREEIRVAVETTLAAGFGKNHSLCHGDVGNLDFLLEAARTLGDEELRRQVDRLAGGVLRGIEKEGWLFGLAGNVETPGLMVGLAGIGYGLLRLAVPGSCPSILALNPPDSGA